MRKLGWPALFVSLTVALAHTANAYMIIGTGATSCGEWIAARRNPYSSAQATTNGEWILAFIAGEAYQEGTDPLTGTDADGVWAWIDNYCGTHPLDEQVDAAKAFYRARVGH